MFENKVAAVILNEEIQKMNNLRMAQVAEHRGFALEIFQSLAAHICIDVNRQNRFLENNFYGPPRGVIAEISQICRALTTYTELRNDSVASFLQCRSLA